MAFDDYLIVARTTRAPVDSRTFSSSREEAHSTAGTAAQDDSATTSGTTEWNATGTWESFRSGRTEHNGTSGSSEGGRTFQSASALFTQSSSQSTSASAQYTTLTTGGTTTTATSSGEGSTSSSTDNRIETYTTTDTDGNPLTLTTTLTVTEAFVIGTSDGTTNMTFSVGGTSTLPYTYPRTSSATYTTVTTTVGGTAPTTKTSSFTTDTTGSYNQVTTASSMETRSTMLPAFTTITVDDFIQYCSTTYWVPDRILAWELTDSATGTQLSLLSDLAQTHDVSFTTNAGTSMETDNAATLTNPTLQFTFYPLLSTTTASSENTVTTTTLGSTITITTFGAPSRIPNSTGTATTLGTVTTTVTGELFLGGTTSDTDNPSTAYTTTTNGVQFEIPTTSVAYLFAFDASGQLTGFTTGLSQEAITTTAAETLTKLTAIVFSDVGTNFTSLSTFAQGRTFQDAETTYGMTDANTASFSRLEPYRPNGVCVPEGLINSRRPHYRVLVGTLNFPNSYALGQAPIISAPFCMPGGYSTTDASASYTVLWDYLSVSVTRKEGTSTTSGSGPLSATGQITNEFWAEVGGSHIGGWTPDGRSQKCVLNRAIMDISDLDDTTGGSIRSQDATTDNPGTAGSVISLLKAYDPAPNTGTPVVLIEKYVGGEPFY